MHALSLLPSIPSFLVCFLATKPDDQQPTTSLSPLSSLALPLPSNSKFYYAIIVDLLLVVD